MRIVLLRHTADPDRVCAAAAASCYSARAASELAGDLSQARVERLLAQSVDKGHHSVLEHASFTFSIEGGSRSMTHQLVRHRIASYSQQSQRYVRMDEADYVVPPRVDREPGAREAFVAAMDGAWAAYDSLVGAGVPEEDARYVLPNAATTNITVTMNARELLHFFRLRAQWEIRRVANRMLELVRPVAPAIFARAGRPCEHGDCPEDATDCPLYPGGEGKGPSEEEG